MIFGEKFRREILRILDSEPRTFTELLNHFDISSGKLTYHINQIKGFTLKNEETAKYEITSLGSKALEILDLINREIPETNQPLLKEAFVSQKEASNPLILQGINISIGFICFFMVIHVLIAPVIVINISRRVYCFNVAYTNTKIYTSFS
jgi:DNA-binding HxlR family transcriptional regulator